MGNQAVGLYWICGQEYTIYGCWDKDTKENCFDFYDVYNAEGICINEGEPFYKFPTWEELKEYLNV